MNDSAQHRRLAIAVHTLSYLFFTPAVLLAILWIVFAANGSLTRPSAADMALGFLLGGIVGRTSLYLYIVGAIYGATLAFYLRMPELSRTQKTLSIIVLALIAGMLIWLYPIVSSILAS